MEPERKAAVFELSRLEDEREELGDPWLQFLQVPSLRTGLYVLPAGAEDRQRPHAEDEIYYVIRGKAVLQIDGEDHPVSAGAVAYVAARVDHRFHSIEEELEVLVVFACGS